MDQILNKEINIFINHVFYLKFYKMSLHISNTHHAHLNYNNINNTQHVDIFLIILIYMHILFNHHMEFILINKEKIH
jgi:hypothetical protein